MKIGLGAAQFGMDYGISTVGGQTSEEEIRRILSFAREEGIDLLDTAHAYGSSEEALGKVMTVDQDFRIISKLPSIQDGRGEEVRAKVRHFLSESLARLRKNRLYGFFVHEPRDLHSSKGPVIYDELLCMKNEGLVEKIGISVYAPGQIDDLLSTFKFDIIQLPLNVFDRRFISDDRLVRLKEKAVEVHVRSIFLQGLLLMTPERLPGFFDPLKDHLHRYRAYLESRNLSPLEGALSFAAAIPQIDYLILGINNVEQLRLNIECLNRTAGNRHFEELEPFAVHDQTYIDPSRWVLG